MTKQLTTLIAALAICFNVAYAQQSKSDETVEFRPHWGWRLHGGASYTMGEASFKDMLSPAAQLSATYNFHHAMGVRIGLGGWQGKGCVVVEEGIYRYNFVQLNADYVLDLAFGLVAEIEHNLISMRTKEALAARKAEGKPLGRKKGNTPKTDILRNQASIISDMKNNGASDKEIYMALGVSKSTYYKYRSKAMSEEITSEACQ
jgi:hypothetical protein